jgi:dTDP-glucose 4,6-dehydratase
VDFEAGVRDAVRWYRDNEAWWGRIKHGTDEFAEWHRRWYEDQGRST